MPGHSQLLIEVRANAICGTDRGLWEAGCDVVPGHEAAGVVIARGPGTTVPVGALGVVYLMAFCGECRSCRLGLTNQCLAKRGDMGFTRDGGYGRFELVDEPCFFEVDADLDPAEATLLLDVMGTAGHAIERARRVREDVASVVVAGAGPVGLGVVAMTRLLLGAEVSVIVADHDSARLAIAAGLGAHTVDLASRSIADATAETDLSNGADVAVDTSGRESARLELVGALGPRGVLMCVGHGEGLSLDVSRDLIAPERAVLGSEYFRFDELSRNLGLLRGHRAELSRIITHRVPRARAGRGAGAVLRRRNRQGRGGAMSDTFQAAPGARPDVGARGEPIRVAVVGTGRWWGRQHARVFAQRPDTDLVAVVGRDPARTTARAEEVGARPYTDVQAMLDTERPDLVSVCLPNTEHYAITLQLIQARVPLFVEKPLVFELVEADRLLAEAEDHGLFVAFDFNHRYARPVQLAADAIAGGRIGEVTFATWRFGGEGAAAHPDANLIETQCHGFDMLEHLAGDIASVAAEFTERAGNGHSSLSIATRFDSGAVGSLVGSYDSSYAYRESHRVEINGTAGRILIVDTVRRFELQLAESARPAEVWEAGYFNDLDRNFHRTLDRHVDDLLAALRAGGEPPIPLAAGRRALQLALASTRSFAEDGGSPRRGPTTEGHRHDPRRCRTPTDDPRPGRRLVVRARPGREPRPADLPRRRGHRVPGVVGGPHRRRGRPRDRLVRRRIEIPPEWAGDDVGCASAP